MDRRSIENFPSQDLRTINQLWLAASQERFGFSVQKKIWMDLVGKPVTTSDNVFNRFIEQVQWAENQAICFEQRAAKGHLPLGMYVTTDGWVERIHSRWWVETERIRKKEQEEREEKIKRLIKEREEGEEEIKRLRDLWEEGSKLIAIQGGGRDTWSREKREPEWGRKSWDKE